MVEFPKEEHLSACPYCKGELSVYRVIREDGLIPEEALEAMELDRIDCCHWLYECKSCHKGVWQVMMSPVSAKED